MSYELLMIIERRSARTERVDLSSVTGYSTDATESYTWNNQGGVGMRR